MGMCPGGTVGVRWLRLRCGTRWRLGEFLAFIRGLASRLVLNGSNRRESSRIGLGASPGSRLGGPESSASKKVILPGSSSRLMGRESRLAPGRRRHRWGEQPTLGEFRVCTVMSRRYQHTRVRIRIHLCRHGVEVPQHALGKLPASGRSPDWDPMRNSPLRWRTDTRGGPLGWTPLRPKFEARKPTGDLPCGIMHWHLTLLSEDHA